VIACAQSEDKPADHVNRLVDAKILLKGVEYSGSVIIINYEIPYSGMVEIRLFNKSGEKIWQSQYPNKYGENRIVLKAEKFAPGETYAYQLNYKTDEVTSQILVPSE
jgi:hypothetical protein